MRKCNQKQCGFLNNGCKKCEDCGCSPNMIAEDCLRCYECENIPNCLRWNDNKNTTEKENEKPETEKKEIVIEEKAK